MIDEIIPQYRHKRREYKCSVCNNNFYWNDESAWYGQLEDKNQKENIEYLACSEKCIKILKDNGILDE